LETKVTSVCKDLWDPEAHLVNAVTKATWAQWDFLVKMDLPAIQEIPA
jgi:hypothetical protein